MSDIVDATLSFWEVYPAFKSIKPFKEFYEGNEAVESSMLMWFIAYCYKLGSPFYGMEEGRKLEMVGESLLGDKKYYKKNKEELDHLIEPYCEVVDSAWDRELRVWDKKMDEKTVFINSLPYDADTWEMIDKMLGANVKLHQDLERIQKAREIEKSGVKKGGGLPSESDTGNM